MTLARLYHSIVGGFKSLWVWLPVIWMDRWWDQVFLYRVLRHKLHLMESGFRKHGISLDASKMAVEMEHCVRILDRLIEDDYVDLSEYRRKYGKLSWSPKFDDPVQDPVQAEADTMFLDACKKADAWATADIHELFSFMAEHIQRWWD